MTKIAIACQGGGSQTAFTAGVLKGLLEGGVHQTHQIVSLSGTSGGGVCAALAWYSLIKASKGDSTPLGQRLTDFWQDNSAQGIFEQWFNDSLVHYSRLCDRGMIPQWSIAPASMTWKALSSVATAFLPRPTFYDFRTLLEAHLDFAEIQSWSRTASPVLVIGAANVLKGEFRKFSSLNDEIRVETLLASAAVPTIFPAVIIGEDAYWDGLFSDNPPTDELLDPEIVGKDNIPTEIWIIQINPKTCRRIPTTPEDILDRRNEMEGNESLYQDIEKIRLINRFIEEKAFTEAFLERYRRIALRTIEMPSELHECLDYATKLDRNPNNLHRLICEGEKQAKQFLAGLGIPASA